MNFNTGLIIVLQERVRITFMAKIIASSRFKLKSFPNTLCCRKYPEDDVIMDEAIIFPFCRCNKQVITCRKGTTCLSGTD